MLHAFGVQGRVLHHHEDCEGDSAEARASADIERGREEIEYTESRWAMDLASTTIIMVMTTNTCNKRGSREHKRATMIR